MAPVPSPGHYVPGATQVLSSAFLKDVTYFTEGETKAGTETQPPLGHTPRTQQGWDRYPGLAKPGENWGGRCTTPNPPNWTQSSQRRWLDPVQSGSGPVCSSRACGLNPKGGSDWLPTTSLEVKAKTPGPQFLGAQGRRVRVGGPRAREASTPHACSHVRAALGGPRVRVGGSQQGGGGRAPGKAGPPPGTESS